MLLKNENETMLIHSIALEKKITKRTSALSSLQANFHDRTSSVVYIFSSESRRGIRLKMYLNTCTPVKI